jgi:hypothetical protein
MSFINHQLFIMKRICFAVMFLHLIVAAHAQSAAGKKILMRPPEFKSPTETTAQTLTNSGSDKGIDPWYVYSDRKPNYSFTQPGGIELFQSLDYLNQYFVIDEEADFLRLAKANDYDPVEFTLPEDAVDMGWVKKHNLLLWPGCIVTDQGRIEKKAMVMNTVDLVKAKRLNIEKLESDKVQFYYSSSLRESTGRESTMFEVFFAYKITDTAVFLGNKDRAREETELEIANMILGWVPRNRVVMWDHRVAVEPNWDKEAVIEREKNDIKAAVFPGEQEAREFMYGSAGLLSAIIDESSIKGEYYDERMIGEWFRYAVYHEKDGIMNLGVTGEINTPKGELDKISKAQIDRQVSIARTKLRNINIVFVIDGTNSMQPYLESVSMAIDRSMDQLSRKYPEEIRSNIRFGAAVYRDHAEKERLIEVKNLTSNYKEVSGFLQNIEAKDIYDEDYPEALFYGLKTALLGVLGDDNETNVIVLVGDAGNHDRDDESQVSVEVISELVAEKKCAFLAFQVHNDLHPTYDEFRSQVQTFMLNAGQILYNSMKPELIEGYTIDAPKWNRLNENTLRLENYVNLATLIYAEKNQVMDSELLTDEIVEVVQKNVERTDETIMRINRVVSEGSSLSEVLDDPSAHYASSSKYISSFNPALLNFFLNNLNIDKSKVEFLCDKKFQIHAEGFAPLTATGLEHPLFRKTLLLSRNDLSKILGFIDNLYAATTMGDRRIAIQNAYIDMIERHIGKMDKQELMLLTVEEISSKVVGLPGTNSFINKIRLEDLTNPGVIPDHELNIYANEIDRKRESLRRIFNESRYNPYEYSLELNEVVYYWIEDNLLP